MTPYEELFAIAARLESVGASAELASAEDALRKLDEVASRAGRAFCGSWLGYHAYVYYDDLKPPPPGARFSQEWGLKDMSFTSMGSRGDWREYDPKELEQYLRAEAGSPDLEVVSIHKGIHRLATYLGERHRRQDEEADHPIGARRRTKKGT